MKIGVLIPCYNAEPYLAECLDSALRQTYPQIEIFCCDDGSTDGTRRMLAEYVARWPNVHVTAQENRGVSATRNRLMDELPDDIEAFAFLDADDTVAPEAYAMLAEALVRTNADVAEMGGPPGGRVIDSRSRKTSSSTTKSMRRSGARSWCRGGSIWAEPGPTSPLRLLPTSALRLRTDIGRIDITKRCGRGFGG